MPHKVPTNSWSGRLFFGAAVGLTTVLLLCAASVVSYVTAIRWVEHALDVRQAVNEWGTALLDAEASVRGYVASERPDFLSSYEVALAQEQEKAALVSRLVAGNASQVDNVAEASRDAQIAKGHLQRLVGFVRAGRRDEALAFLASGESRLAIGAFRQDVRRIRREEDRLLAAHRLEASTRGWLTFAGALLLAAASCGLLVLGWRREHAHETLVETLAREARARLRALSALAAALSDARSPSAVAAVVVEQGMRAVGADACALYMIDETGDAWDLAAERGMAPEIVERVRRITEESGSPKAFAAIKAGRATWAEDDAAHMAIHPAFATAAGRGGKAFWSVPLLSEERPIGLLDASFREGRKFSEDERAFVETLANLCGIALLRAARTEREHDVRRWLTTTLRSIGDAVIATDAKGAITFMNPIAEELTGWSEVEARGRALDDVFRVFSRDTGEALESPVARVLRGAAPAGAARQPMLRSKSGAEIPIAESGAPMRNEAGRIIGVVLVFRDVTEEQRVLKAAEDARAKERWLRDEAELASRAKDDFLATVSHELRTPLNAILGWTMMLRNRGPSEEIDRALTIVERNARTQAKLIDDVLDVSRIISGKLALNLGPTNVADVVAAAIETVTPAAVAKEIVIDAEVADGTLTITADADRMQQVVWNLLSNAVKFTPKGRKVSVRVSRQGGDVGISVKDTGEGIRPEVLPLVFEPFQQADASTTRRHGGLGLGLAIVKQLVVAHGGSVRARSDGPGRGATFEVQLPARSAVVAVGRSARAAATMSVVKEVKRGPRIDGLRILVVDDEYDARALVGQVLAEHGADVHVAASVEEALEKFAAVRPDVIVSDVGMPDADGYALIRRIRAFASDAGGRTPAIALTAYARVEDAQRAFVAGYQMHVAKPVEPSQLVIAVADLGGRRVA